MKHIAQETKRCTFINTASKTRTYTHRRVYTQHSIYTA